MPLRYEDRVWMTSSTTGTGTFTLGSAIAGHRSFGSAINDGDTCFYHAEEVNGSGIPTGAWEIGYGTYTHSGTTLSRDKILSSSGTHALPTIASVGTAATGDSVTSLATNAPSGVQVGDLLVMCVGCGGNPTVTATGWANTSRVVDATNSRTIAYLLRVADGTAADTPTISLSQTVDATAVILRITGYKVGDVYDVLAGTEEASTTTPAIASITTTEANTLLIASIIQSSRNWTADPSTWTQQSVTDGNSGVTMGLGLWSKNAATVGTYGGETATLSASALTNKAALSINGNYPKVSFANSLRISIIAPAAKLGYPDIQIFTTSGVWTKPLWATECDVICVGGGGGGGSGNSSTANGAQVGRGGGSGGVITRNLLKASTLNNLETVTIGAAGAGGTTSNGTAGGATSFGNWVYAGGGATSSSATAGAAQGTTGLFQQASLAGGNGGTGGAGTAAANGTTVQCPGGGGGGGTSTSAAFNGGAGGGFSANSVTVNSVAGGSAGVAGGSINGGNGNTLDWLYGIQIGTGGGGGASAWNAGAGATGGNGGNATGYGAGGGGGGSATCTGGTATMGTGGNGAPGICVVVSY